MRFYLAAILVMPVLAALARDERYLVEPTTEVSASDTAITLNPADEPLTHAVTPIVEKTGDLEAGDLVAGDSSIYPIFYQPGGLEPPLRPNFSPIYNEERAKPKRRTNPKTLNRGRRDVKETKEVKKETKSAESPKPLDLDKGESRMEFQTASYPEVPPRPRKQQPPQQQQQQQPPQQQQQPQQQRPKRRPQPEASFQAVPPQRQQMETVSSTPKERTAYTH